MYGVSASRLHANLIVPAILHTFFTIGYQLTLKLRLLLAYGVQAFTVVLQYDCSRGGMLLTPDNNTVDVSHSLA